MTGSFWRRSVASLPAAIAGGALSSILVAALDARAAAEAGQSGFAPLFLASLGLTGWFVVSLGVGTRVTALALFSESAWQASLDWMRPSDPGQRRERAAVSALAPLGLGLWFLMVAAVARALLSSALSPSAVGVSVALAALALGALLALSVQGVARAARAVATEPPTPAVALGAASLVVLGVLALGVLTGAPSGAGGPLAMLGVLTRDELDLRPLGFCCLGLAAPLLVKAPRRRAVAAAYCVLALGPLAALIHAAERGLAARETAISIERSAPLAAKLLPALRRLADRDHDGFSALFGGGDCDDRRSERSPAALDVPANGVDEDCSGTDAARLAPEAPPASTPGGDAAAIKARLPERLNVVLITIDTLRYDLGYAGNPRPVSPALDRLARASVVFERAYALASYTAKSLPPMLIGRYSGETHRGYSHFNRFEKSDTFLAERLQRAGVHTLSVQGHWYFFQNYGMERGFDVVDTSAAPRAAQVAEGDRSSTSERLSDAVLAKLAKPELKERPFFMWAHYTDPHAEYVPHPGFDFGAGSRAAYDGEVAFVDQQVGRVLEGLFAGPLAANTAVIVSSDHGEAFGEHAMIRHGFELWEELVRVPLIVHVPGFAPARIGVPRSAIDLVPTILELMRQPLPDPAGPDALSGVSLLADLALPSDQTPRERPIFIDMSEGPHNAERRAFIDGGWKLVTSRGRVLGLYDLNTDPAEKRDLASDKARLAPISERFQAFRRSLREVVVR